ncbi:MAG: UMP kinase [Clostridiales bacterium]|nr:UMP kinase [Clostridiales bacterium]
MECEKKPSYRRVLLKLSGEALRNGKNEIIDFSYVKEVCLEIMKWKNAGVQIAIVIGAGNIWRGRQGDKMDQTRADHMGMLATTINCLAMQDVFLSLGTEAEVFTAADMPSFAHTYTRDDAVQALEDGKIVLFGCGLGNPYFSTDTAAVLRAAEIGADISLFAKNIDGVYTADPKKDAQAVRYDTLSYEEILSKRLAAIDLTAAAFCLANQLKVLVFGLDDPANIGKAIQGEKIGTILRSET